VISDILLRANGRLFEESVLKHNLQYTEYGLFKACSITEMNGNRQDSLYTYSLDYVCTTLYFIALTFKDVT
jgi:hypothetical protein